MHRVLSVGSLEVTDSKAHELKGVSLDALVASFIRGVAFLLSATTQEALMDATMQLYHGYVLYRYVRRLGEVSARLEVS